MLPEECDTSIMLEAANTRAAQSTLCLVRKIQKIVLAERDRLPDIMIFGVDFLGRSIDPLRSNPRGKTKNPFSNIIHLWTLLG